MFDCANVEMRELLPDLVAGTLDASTRARVDEHVLGCAECASELETLRLVRGAFAAAPSVDTRRIVAALPKPVRSAPHATPAPVKRWMDWRIAAALTMITVGGLSLAVADRLRTGRPNVPADLDTTVAVTDSTNRIEPGSVESPKPPNREDTVNRSPNRGAQATRVAKAELSIGGGVSDLDDASIQALLGALDEIDRAPVAPSAEPDRSPVLPVIKEGER